MKEWEIPRRDVAAAVRENVKTKSQRVRTINNFGSEQMDKVVESVKRKFMRTLFFKKRPSTECKEMMEQADKAAAYVARVAANGTVQDFIPRQDSNPLPAQENCEVLDNEMKEQAEKSAASVANVASNDRVLDPDQRQDGNPTSEERDE
jgi:hypothetical protein